MEKPGALKKHGCRAVEFGLCGMRALALENERIRVTVLLDKGADIIEFRDKARDLDVLWGTPWGLRAPFSAMPSVYSSSGNYLDFYEGGWQELFPSIGDPARVNGAELGVHGEACLLPWQWRLVEESGERVEVQLSARMLRTPFLLSKRMSLKKGQRALWIEERALNEGGVAMPLAWGHHPALGGPFLDGELFLDIPAQMGHTFPTSFHPDFPADTAFSWPWAGEGLDLSAMPALKGKWAGIAYAAGLREGWCALTNPGLGLGFGLAFDKALFQNVWLWMVYEGLPHAPWYGRTRCLAMEPYSSVPDQLERAVERGTALTLPPGGEMETQLCAVLYETRGRVGRVDLSGGVWAAEGEKIC